MYQNCAADAELIQQLLVVILDVFQQQGQTIYRQVLYSSFRIFFHLVELGSQAAINNK